MRLSDAVALVGSGDVRLTSRYDCNAYAIDAPDGTVLVDTGAGDTGTGETIPAMIERAEDVFGSVTHALLTHAHADHSQGGPVCQERGITVVASEATTDLLASGSEHALGVDVAREEGVYPEQYTIENYDPDVTFEPGETITVAGRCFETVRVRGHAADHVAYLTEDSDRTYCFVGDAIYPDGSISLLNVPGSSLADYRADVENLVGLDVDALLPGHGHPMLADGSEAIETAAEALAGMSSPPSKT